MFSANLDTTRMLEALRAKRDAVTRATRTAQYEAAHTVEARIKMRLSRTAHPAGTSTPAPAGGPPAVVTGTLRRSVRTSRLISLGAHRSEISVGPTVVYGRAQDQGAHIVPRTAPALAFRIDGHFVRVSHVDLPARPFVKPVVDDLKATGELARIYRRHWAAALRGSV